MEKIFIHNLQRYKLVLQSEQGVKVEAKSDTPLEEGKGLENKVFDLQFQDPVKGWTRVRNPQLAFEIADLNRLRVSSSYLEYLNPSFEFLENRRKANEDKKEKPKRKRRHKRRESK